MQAMEIFVKLKFDDDRAVAAVDGSEIATRFRVIDVPSLTERTIDAAVVPSIGLADPLLVRFERASAVARDRLRELRISWCGPDDELYLFTPNLHVERQPHRGNRESNASAAPRPTNYFSRRSSRVARWLLNHPQDEPTVRSLAAELELSESTVSRAVSALARDRFVVIVDHLADGREKRFRLRDGDRLLENWARVRETKHVESVRWDIGTWDVESTIDQFVRGSRMLDDQTADPDERMRWCLGGLSGAAFVKKVVEPSSVFVWVDKSQIHKWERQFLPAEQSRRGGDGLLTLWLAEDPFLFSIATPRISDSDDLWGAEVKVADPVQLFLDCRRAGERGLEAAEAMKATLEIADGWRS